MSINLARLFTEYAVRAGEDLKWDGNDRIRTADQSPVIRLDAATGERFVTVMRWGLIPHWAKDAREGANSVNARSETVHEKPTFKRAFRERRCLVPAESWIEWSEEYIPGTKRKQPYRFSLPDGKLATFAGLWSDWTDPQTGEVISSYAILTTEAVGEIAKVHDRQPLILRDRPAADAWLNTKATVDELRAMLKPYDGPVIVEPTVLRDLAPRKAPIPRKPKPPREQQELF